MLLLPSCSTVTTLESSEETGGRAETEEAGGIIPTGSAEGSSSEPAPTATGSSSGGDSSDEGGNSFLDGSTSGAGVCGNSIPDGVVRSSVADCSVFAQDCCPGEACRAWANDGGSQWNATRCVPVDPEAGSVGEPCTVQGSAVTGLDSCDVGLMCWEVDSDSFEGTCIEVCGGSESEPTCSSPDDVCGIYNDGVLALCLPGCDLPTNDCEGDDVCVPAGDDTFGCIDEGYPRCRAGTSEVVPSQGADCSEGEPCCAPYCDLADGASCGEGFLCVSFDAPYPAYPDLGVCVPDVER
ncbi:MAG: hypothetical protein ACRBN8_12410 [Nannocystales bacterium]